MLPIVLSAMLAAQNSTQANDFFSKAALTEPLRGCGRQGHRPPISSFEAAWYAKVWVAANEPPLATTQLSSALPVWRFTVIPTWTAPLSFRISKQVDGTYHLVAKRLSGQGGYDVGRLKDQVVKTLSPDEQRRFVQEIALAAGEAACPQDEGIVVMDGTKLILETKVGGTYTVGQRESLPEEPMLALSHLLEGFAGWVTQPGVSD